MDAITSMPQDTPPALFSNWSSNDLQYTVSWSKISCLYEMYFAHVVCCYFVALSGAACLITRLHPVLHPAHAWSGRIYILSMMWATATSLLIHNTGLPPAVLLSFIWALGGMSLAWVVIVVYSNQMTTAATKSVSEKLRSGEASLKLEELPKLINKEKGVLAAKRTCLQRVFNLKAFHGALMFMSWMNIVGRIFASDQSGDFQCYTEPYYKAAYTTSGFPEPVPTADPDYARLPWAKTGLIGWGVALSVGPLCFSYVFGAVWAAVAGCCSKRRHVATSS